jgi:hypothetical protein
MCTYLDVVEGLVWLNDRRVYANSGPPILSRLPLTLQTKMSSVASVPIVATVNSFWLSVALKCIVGNYGSTSSKASNPSKEESTNSSGCSMHSGLWP